MISLRSPEAADAKKLCARWAPDHLPGYRIPEDAEEMNALIAEWNRGKVQGRRFRMLLIEVDGESAGLVSLYEKEAGVAIGISVHPDFQKRGIGTEAVALAAEFARLFGREKFVSECRTDNAASIALHEKCGFKRTGERVNRRGNRVICWEKPIERETKKE